MRCFVFVLAAILLGSCSEKSETHIENIEGYWEIERVILPNGKEHVYSFNESVDYFHITDSLTGFRKKLKPNFKGTFETSKNAEFFFISLENDSINLYYKTPFDSWKETVLFVNKTQLKIINKNKTVYLYKRFTPITID